MIRKAKQADLDVVVEIYTKIVRNAAAGKSLSGWREGVYPTMQTAQTALDADELFVLESDGAVVAAARINNEQDPRYVQANWKNDTPDEKVMVLHTLVVDPDQSGKGYASQFVAFYEAYAREKGCLALRMDTNVINTPARTLYTKLGFEEAGVVSCYFENLGTLQLLCFEKSLAEV